MGGAKQLLTNHPVTSGDAVGVELRPDSSSVGEDSSPRTVGAEIPPVAVEPPASGGRSCGERLAGALETCCADIGDDLHGRLPLYLSDWATTDGIRCTLGGSVKIFSASLFSYISSVLPAIVIGDLLFSSTGGQIGLPEVLVSTGMTGVIWAFIGGQPLCIIGVTMPVAIFTSVCYILSLELQVPFLPWMGWICVFSGIMHILLAASGAVHFVHKTTAFSCEIFGFFISVTYIYDALAQLLGPILSNRGIDAWSPLGSSAMVYLLRERSASFANACLATGTYIVCMALHRAPRWSLFTPRIRTALADYAAPLGIVIFTLVSYIPYVSEAVGDARLDVPENVFGPSGLLPSFDRSWLNPLLPGTEAAKHAAEAAAEATAEVLDRAGVNVTAGTLSLLEGAGRHSLKYWHVSTALAPALMLTALFFFDHNVSSKLAQDPKFKLRKPTAYHWDFSVLGLEVLLCGLFAVPPGNGLIPQAPLHTRALANCKIEAAGNGQTREVFSDVVETRWSNLLQSLGVLLSVFALPALACIPSGCLDGTFLFLGMAGFGGNGLWERSWLVLTQPSLRPDNVPYMRIPWRKTRLYTVIQLAFVICVFILAKLPFVAVLFPLLIAVLIPFRMYALPRWFTQEELDALDPPEDASDTQPVVAGAAEETSPVPHTRSKEQKAPLRALDSAPEQSLEI